MVSTTPSASTYARPMTGYTRVLTQSTGTASAQPNACRILSTTSVSPSASSRHAAVLMKDRAVILENYERVGAAADWGFRGLCGAGRVPILQWADRRRGVVARGQPHPAERLLLPPRRTDLERRAGERRLELISLEQERRDQAERRQPIDRRQPAGRRQAEPGHHAELAVLVVSDRDEAALRVRDLLNGAAPDRFSVAAAAPNESHARLARGGVDVVLLAMSLSARRGFATRSEERRVGKECRSRWSPY